MGGRMMVIMSMFDGTKKESFGAWRDRMRAYLGTKKLWRYVASAPPRPGGVEEQALGEGEDPGEGGALVRRWTLEQWEDLNLLVFSELSLYTSGEANELVCLHGGGNECNGLRAWEALNATYDPTGEDNMIDLRVAVWNRAMGKDEDPDLYVCRQEADRRRLRENGIEVTDGELLVIAVKNLPESYEQLGVMARADPTAFDWHKFKVMARATYRARESRKEAKALETAMYGQVRQPKLCYTCQSPDHEARGCPQRAAGGPKPAGGGFVSRGGRGAGRNGGRGRGGPGRGRGSEGRQGGGWGSADWATVKCSRCHKLGHPIRACGEQGQQQQPSVHFADHEFEVGYVAEEVGEEVPQQEEDVGFMAQELGEVALRAEDRRESGRVRRLIADSGTTTTMVNSVEGLHDVVYRCGRVLTAGGVIESVAEGKMHVKVLDTRGRVGRLYINRVVVIPSLARGLFSVTQAAQQGARMVLDATSGWLVWDTIEVQLRSVRGACTCFKLSWRARMRVAPRRLATGITARSLMTMRRIWRTRRRGTWRSSLGGCGMPSWGTAMLGTCVSWATGALGCRRTWWWRGCVRRASWGSMCMGRIRRVWSE